MKGFNIFEKFATDSSKEVNGAKFYLDETNDCYILVARWCPRNYAHNKAQAELTVKYQGENSWELEKERCQVVAKYLVKGWHNIVDANDKPIPFSTEKACELFDLMPDLADLVVSFAVNRDNYPVDKVGDISKN